MNHFSRTLALTLGIALLSESASAETIEQKLLRLEALLRQQQAQLDAQDAQLKAQALMLERQQHPIGEGFSGGSALRADRLGQYRGRGTTTPTNTQLAATAAAEGDSLPDKPVGQAPEQSSASPTQSTLSTSRRVSVTRERGSFYFEPTLSFVHSSSSRVAVEGFSVIPSIIVGLINVQETRRDTLTAALNFRYALSDRFEVGARIPFIYREEQIRDRELLSGSELAALTDSDGSGLGDIDFSAHYKLTSYSEPGPYYTLNLRVKTTTGDGPFDVPRRQVTIDDDNDPNTPERVVGEFFLEQPTGSGFYSIEPSITVAYPTDPAALYASFGYMWNLEHDSDTPAGRVDPGDAINFSFGMGFAINERASFNLGYGHSIVLKSDVENSTVSDTNFDRFHVGSLKFGLNYRLNERRSANLNLSVGATDDAPDMQLSFGLPTSY